MICSPVFRPTVPEDILRKIEIKGIALAEGSLVNDDNQVEIDILVGLDYYWKLLKPKISVLSPHLSAQETKFGWILSGSWEERGQKGDKRNRSDISSVYGRCEEQFVSQNLGLRNHRNNTM